MRGFFRPAWDDTQVLTCTLALTFSCGMMTIVGKYVNLYVNTGDR